MVKPQKIRLEKIERFFLPNVIRRFCAKCEAEQIFVSAERATFISNLTTREIFRLVENGQIHFYESEDGLTQVCTISLASFLPHQVFDFEYRKKLLSDNDLMSNSSKESL